MSHCNRIVEPQRRALLHAPIRLRHSEAHRAEPHSGLESPAADIKNATGKLEHFRWIKRESGCAYQDMIFFDDLPANVKVRRRELDPPADWRPASAKAWHHIGVGRTRRSLRLIIPQGLLANERGTRG
eukprot:768590-Hanusia_phi.AAC.25